MAKTTPIGRGLDRRVLRLVAEVPAGCVTTYGAIADALDAAPRQVARILAQEPEAANIPWHRVVAAGGRLTIPSPRVKAEQIRRLRAEGVGVANDRVQQFAAVRFAP